MNMDNNININNNQNFMNDMNNNQINNPNFMNNKNMNNMMNINNNLNNNNIINMNIMNSQARGDTLLQQANNRIIGNFSTYKAANNLENNLENNNNFMVNNDNEQEEKYKATIKYYEEQMPHIFTSVENDTKIIQKGNFDKDEINRIKEIIIYNKGKTKLINQKLKDKFGGEWFVLSFEKTPEHEKEDFDFKFTNNTKENVFIFSDKKYKYFICKLLN